ncbi:MAG: hypothetical protein LBG89_01200 [Rickettsiales bacterium]|jgi:hypothetical protein|nr:hypothetical protein [Rickettsiales bacterium]
MKKLSLLALAALVLTGCYGYTTNRTFDANGNKKDCTVVVAKTGNMVFGYEENTFSNMARGEKDCKEWMKK